MQMPTKELRLNRFDSLKQWHAALFPRCNCLLVCRIKALDCDNVLNEKGQSDTSFITGV